MSAPSSVNVSGSILSARRSPGCRRRVCVLAWLRYVVGVWCLLRAISNYLTGTYTYCMFSALVLCP